MTSTLQVVDLLTLIAGLGGIAGLLIWLQRTGRWRDPLATAPLPTGGPRVDVLLAVVAGYILIHLLVQVALLQGHALDEAQQPGTPAWHRLHLAKLAADVLLIIPLLFLRHRTNRAEPRPRVTAARAAAGALLVLLILLPIMTVQINMGEAIWTWLYPDLDPPRHEVLETLPSASDVQSRALLFVGAIATTPVIEELLFRGVLLGTLAYYVRAKWPAIILSAIAFGVVHAQPQDVLPLVTMGILLGALRIWSGRLWPCILVHVLFNARTMVFMFLAQPLPDTA